MDNLVALPEYNAYSVPIAQIWVDPEFNCRGQFTPDSITALAKSIRDGRLEYPIYVQPWDKNPGYCYRLIAGFRRLAACRMLHMVEMPAMITDRDMSEFEAHKLNLLENLERNDLNVLEEAQGIKRIFPLGESPGEIAKELNRPRQWVYRRLGLLDLPHGVQLMFASGRLAQSDLDTVLAYRDDPEKALDVAQKLLEARHEGPDKVKAMRRQFHRGRYVKDCRRTKAEIAAMIAYMFELGIDGLPTRVAAWCAGTLTTADLRNDLGKI
jgi:ParB/RepB/Spo0J family partition protein